MNRPSHREILRKLGQAKEAVRSNAVDILNPVSIAADALELGIDIEDLQGILSDLLDEIKPGDYAGQSPPQRSYEREIYACELFPFRWMSKRLGCLVYMKFALKDNRMWLVSLHEDRKDTGGK